MVTHVSGLHSLAIYTPKGRVNQFLCKFNSTSDNAALFSNSHKLGIHQLGSLASNGDSESLSGSGRGGIALCQKGAKYKERTRIHQGSEHWVNSLRQNSEVFKSPCKRKECFPPTHSWQFCERQCRNWPQQHRRDNVSPSVSCSRKMYLIEPAETGFTSQPPLSLLSLLDHTCLYTIWGNISNRVRGLQNGQGKFPFPLLSGYSKRATLRQDTQNLIFHSTDLQANVTLPPGGSLIGWLATIEQRGLWKFRTPWEQRGAEEVQNKKPMEKLSSVH